MPGHQPQQPPAAAAVRQAQAAGAQAMQHVARKRFGQHFLTDAAVIDAIVRAIDPQPGDALLEIGPGLGALTRPLLERVQRMRAIELDRDLAARLREQLPQTRLDVIEADVLKVDFAPLAQTALARAGCAALRVVGNLPYNISSPILFHLLPVAAQVRDQYFMLQNEVVNRMVAAPCTASYGRLSVMLQWRYAMEKVLHVPPAAFEPPPKVDSAVVRMLPRAGAAPVALTHLSQLVQVAFSQRRKLLRHTLGRWLQERQYAGAFDVQRRAEEVPVAQYVALALETQGAAD